MASHRNAIPDQISNTLHSSGNDTSSHAAPTVDIWKRDSPEHDFYSQCFSFTPLIATTLVSVNGSAIFFILLPFPTVHELPAILVLHLYLCVLIGTVACRQKPQSRGARVAVRTACFAFYLLVISCGIGLYLPFKVRFGVLMEVLGFVVPIIALYLLFAGLDEFNGWKDQRRRRREREA